MDEAVVVPPHPDAGPHELVGAGQIVPIEEDVVLLVRDHDPHIDSGPYGVLEGDHHGFVRGEIRRGDVQPALRVDDHGQVLHLHGIVGHGVRPSGHELHPVMTVVNEHARIHVFLDGPEAVALLSCG